MSWTNPKPEDRYAKDPAQLMAYIREMYGRGSTFGTFTWDPPEVGATTSVDTTLTTTTVPALTGLRAGQFVHVTPPSTIDAGLIWGAFVASDNSLTIRLVNVTGSPINPASGTWAFDGKLVA